MSAAGTQVKKEKKKKRYEIRIAAITAELYSVERKERFIANFFPKVVSPERRLSVVVPPAFISAVSLVRSKGP